MSDHILISSLRVKTHIGIYPWEQQILQTLCIDIKIPIDLHECNNSLNNTIDYAAVCESVTDLVQNNSYTLIETVAETIAANIKQTYNISDIIITVSKPNAITTANNVSVTIQR